MLASSTPSSNVYIIKPASPIEAKKSGFRLLHTPNHPDKHQRKEARLLMQKPSLPGKDVLHPAPELLEAEECGFVWPSWEPAQTHSAVSMRRGSVSDGGDAPVYPAGQATKVQGFLKEGHVGFLPLPGQGDNRPGLFCSVGCETYQTSVITALPHSGIRDHDVRS